MPNFKTNAITYDRNLNSHCHSDFDMNEDDDPFFEYNKAHGISKLDVKLQSKFTQFNQISISRLMIRKTESMGRDKNLTDLIHDLVNQKYEQKMVQNIYPDEIVDADEVKTYDRYVNSLDKIDRSNNIPTYERYR